MFEVQGKTPPSPRIPQLYIQTGLVFLSLAIGILCFHMNALFTTPRHNPIVLVITHLILLGFGNMVTFGALQQMIPVILSEKIKTKLPGTIVYSILVCGIGLQTSGFFVWYPILIIVGGIMNAVGIVLFTVPYIRPLLSRVQHDTTALFIVTSLVYLHIAVGLGIALAIQLQHVWSTTLFIHGLALHIVFGILGWFTLIIIGVSYKLLPMFTTATAPAKQNMWRVYVWLQVGLGLFVTSILMGSALGVTIGFCVTCIGLYFYIIDIKGVINRRIRRSIIPGMQLSIAAIFYLVISVIISAGMFILANTNGSPTFHAYVTQLYTIIGIVIFFGWISAMILGMLSRIIPMLIWLDKYASRVGQRGVPTLQQMIHESILRKGIIVYQTGLILLTITLGLTSPRATYVATALFSTGVLIIIGTLAHIWFIHREGRNVPCKTS